MCWEDVTRMQSFALVVMFPAAVCMMRGWDYVLSYILWLRRTWRGVYVGTNIATTTAILFYYCQHISITALYLFLLVDSL